MLNVSNSPKGKLNSIHSVNAPTVSHAGSSANQMAAGGGQAGTT